MQVVEKWVIADEYDVTQRTIDNWRRIYGVPAIKKPNGRVYFDREAVRKALEKARCPKCGQSLLRN